MNWNLKNLDWEEPEKEFEELSIVQIQSQDPKKTDFGSGFVFLEDEEGVYILTCAHVIRDVGGIEQVKVNNLSATVVYHSPNGNAEDLAILKVKGLKNLPNLPLGNFRRELSSRNFLTKFRIHGYSEYDSRNRIYILNNIQGHLAELINPRSSKIEIINIIIEYLRRESQIQDFLNLAREHKPQTYEKFSPYYKVPRRPQPRGESAFQRRVAMVVAGTMGVGVSALGVFSLSQLTELLVDFNRSGNSGIYGFISLVSLLGLAALGDFAGQVVLVGTKGRKGEAVGRLAILSYSIGCSIGFSVYNALQSNDQRDFVILFLNALLHLPVMLIIEQLSNGIGMALGGSLSYQRTR